MAWFAMALFVVEEWTTSLSALTGFRYMGYVLGCQCTVQALVPPHPRPKQIPLAACSYCSYLCSGEKKFQCV